MTPNNIKQEAINKLMDNCGVFWAFGKKQFEEGLAKAKQSMVEDEKLIDIGAGGFMPKSNKDKYIDGMIAIGKAFDEAMKDKKELDKHILYELHNHEAFYTGSIESTVDVVGENFRSNILTIYKGHSKSTCGCYK